MTIGSMVLIEVSVILVDWLIPKWIDRIMDLILEYGQYM